MTERMDLAIRFVTNSERSSIGTCFAISNKYYLTAKHVIDGVKDIIITDDWFGNVPEKGTTLIQAKKIWQSEKLDLAVITPVARHTKPSIAFIVPISHEIVPGRPIENYGYPLPVRERVSVKVESIKPRAFNGNIVSSYPGPCPYYHYQSPLIEVSFPVLDGQSGSPILLSGTAGAVIGICLGSSQAYIITATVEEDGFSRHEGYRFGVGLDLRRALDEETYLSEFFL